MKRIEQLRQLSDDHHQGLVLARRARQTAAGTGDFTPPQVWEEIGRRFPQEFDPHFCIEENTLAPALEALGENILVERLRTEHAELRSLAAVKSGIENLRRFGELMEQHIRFEERELFTTAQVRLSPAELERVRLACLQAE